MPPLIQTLRIVPIDEGSPTRKPGHLPKQTLVPPQSELIITQSSHQIISSIYTQEDPTNEKGKCISSKSQKPVNSLKKSEEWSKE